MPAGPSLAVHIFEGCEGKVEERLLFLSSLLFDYFEHLATGIT